MDVENIDQENKQYKTYNDIAITKYLGFCYMRRTVGIHYGFKIWPPPDCNTFTYLQDAKDKDI